MTKEQLTAYLMEIATFGNIPISSRNCKIGCIFCKVHTDPYLKRFPPLPDISLEDLYLGFKYVSKTNKYVRLGAGVLVSPHTDPFLHPLIYDFIKHTSEYFPEKIVTTVTTGSYIDIHKIEYLNNIYNYRIDLSLVTMQASRESIIPISTRNKIYELLKFAPLNKVTLMFTGDLLELEKDLELLHKLEIDKKASEILVRRIEYTRHSKGKLNKLALGSIDNYESCVNYLFNNYPDVTFTVPYLHEQYRGGSNEYFLQAMERINILRERIDCNPKQSYDIICPESSYIFFKQELKSSKNANIILVKNNLYGGSVTVAGLLNHEDIMAQYLPLKPGDTIVLPREMYNDAGHDISGRAAMELKSYYGGDIWIA